MIIVAADTSTQAGSVALKNRGGKILESALPHGRPHSETLLPAIEALLSEGGISRGDVTALAVAVGPGTFTGLRVGLATFKGWASASGLKLAPVPTPDAVAYPLLEESRNVLVCSDARKGEIYIALYRGLDSDGLPNRDGEVALIKPSLFPDFCRERRMGKVWVAGTGLHLVLKEMRGFVDMSPVEDSGARLTGSAILALGERIHELGGGIEPSRLTPYYVRPPDVVDPSRVSR